MEQKILTSLQDTASMIWSYVPTLVGALAILVVGWIVAGWLARLFRVGLEKSGLVRRISKVVSDVDADDARTFERGIGKGVFYILMLFVLIGFFQVLGLNQITQPISGFLNEIFQYLPRLIGPVVLVFIAWVVAKFLRMAVRRGMASTKLDDQIRPEAGDGDAKQVSVSNTAGEAVYWLTFLVFLPAILGSLELGGLLIPVRGMVDTLLGYLPNLFAAGLILFIGWLVAKFVRKIVTNLLASVGTDRLSEKVGLHAALGKQNLSGLIGLVAYILILVPVIVAALNAMSLDAITLPASQMLNEILAAIPNIFAGALLLVIAYVVAKIVSGLVSGLLAGVGFDSLPQRLGLQSGAGATGRSASDIAGFVLIVAIMLFATIEAFSLIGFTAAATLVADFIVFSGHVLLGLFIIGLGLYLAKIVADVIRDTSLPNSAILANIARVAILVLAVAMGLGEMGLGEDIIALAFGLSLGAVAIALAIAFGLGGRDAAAQITAKWSGNSSTGRRGADKDS